MVEAQSTTTRQSDQQWILGLVMFHYLCVALDTCYVAYLWCLTCDTCYVAYLWFLMCVMTRSMICDVGLLYMWKIIVYVYAAVSVCLLWRLPNRGGRQNEHLKKKSYVPWFNLLCSSEKPKNIRGLCSLGNPEKYKFCYVPRFPKECKLLWSSVPRGWGT
jgi:hypothetical protein